MLHTHTHTDKRTCARTRTRTRARMYAHAHAHIHAKLCNINMAKKKGNPEKEIVPQIPSLNHHKVDRNIADSMFGDNLKTNRILCFIVRTHVHTQGPRNNRPAFKGPPSIKVKIIRS